MTPETIRRNGSSRDSTRRSAEQTETGKVMNDSETPRLSSYARFPTAELVRKLESHRRMAAAIEAEIQRRQETGDSDGAALRRYLAEKGARRQAYRDRGDVEDLP